MSYLIDYSDIHKYKKSNIHVYYIIKVMRA